MRNTRVRLAALLVIVASTVGAPMAAADASEAEAPVFSLVDATAAAGLAISDASWGAAWADLDGDGWEDLAVAVSNESQAGCRLYRNRRDGTFEDVSYLLPLPIGYARSVAWGDYNRDGRPDLYVTYEQGGNRLLQNRGGTFVDVTAAARVADGRRSHDAVWADYDRDGWLDLYVCNYGQTNALYHNNGDGTFTDVAASLPVAEAGKRSESASWGDTDGDGYPDLFVCNAFDRSSLFRNNGDGSFTDVTPALGGRLGANNRGAAWGDYDNDGRADLFVTVWTGGGWPDGNLLYHNDGDGSFTECAVAAGVAGSEPNYANGAVWGDFDNDGRLDLSVANDQLQRSTLYHNNGNGTFTEVAQQSGMRLSAEAHGVSAADYDHDGRLDLFFTTHLATPAIPADQSRLFRNVTAAGHWLEVTGALGDSVTVVTPDATFVRRIGEGQGYVGANAPVAHVGLGSYEGPVDVRIAPSRPADAPSEATNLLTDRRLTLPYGYSEPVRLRVPLEVQAGSEVTADWALWAPASGLSQGTQPPRLLWDTVSHAAQHDYPNQRTVGDAWTGSASTRFLAPNYPCILYVTGAMEMRTSGGQDTWVYSEEKPVFVRGVKAMPDRFRLTVPSIAPTGQPWHAEWGPVAGMSGWRALASPQPYLMWDTVSHPTDLAYRNRTAAGAGSTDSWFTADVPAPVEPTILYVRGAVFMAAPHTSDWFFTAEVAVRIATPVGTSLIAVTAPGKVEAFDPYSVTWCLTAATEMFDPPSPFVVWDVVSHPFDVNYPHRETGIAVDGAYQAGLTAPWQIGKVYMRAAMFLREGGEARWFYSEETVVTIAPPLRRVRSELH